MLNLKKLLEIVFKKRVDREKEIFERTKDAIWYLIADEFGVIKSLKYEAKERNEFNAHIVHEESLLSILEHIEKMPESEIWKLPIFRAKQDRQFMLKR